MSNTDINAAKKLGLTQIKKYQKCAGQVAIKLDQLYNQIPALAKFVKYLQKVYNNQKITQNMSFRQNIDLEQISSFFIKLDKFIKCQKTNGKNISDATKLEKKYM